MEDKHYEYLKKRIFELTGINLDDYKSQQMRRRLTTYIGHSKADSVVSFCKDLKENPDSLHRLREFLTINVSEFFRDAHLFEKLKTTVIPELLTRSSSLAIWSAGCSRGQEPYTIAMIFETLFPNVRYRILASDIDEGALKFARNGGPYTSDDIRNIPQNDITKYMDSSEDKWYVKPELKKKISFQQQNILRDPFEENFDLIICRNVTIYFSDEAKHNLNIKFNRSLKQNGILFIGGTEVLLESTRLGFLSRGVCFYQKQGDPCLTKESIYGKIPAKV